MSLNQLLSHWRAEPTIFSNIAEWRKIEARSAQTRRFPDDIHPSLEKSLIRRGINNLYLHQETAWINSKNGKNVIIVTGTASGKSLAYNLPILDSLIRDENARALYIFPTKALSQDQFNKLSDLTRDFEVQTIEIDKQDSQIEFLQEYPVPVAVYDGDTKTNARRAIRENARIVVTNPDMLHMGILPHHTRWAEFFANLNYIVIDEIHVYRGVFGSHVANVLRRIKRVANFYGSNSNFFLTSATIANPVELGEKLIEEPVQVVDQDGSSRGPINFLIYNPPILDPDLGLRRSSLLEGVRLSEDLFYYDVQTIVFGRSRRNVELILTYMRQNLGNLDHKFNSTQSNPVGEHDLIRGYRSGYLPEERRAIEEGLRSGNVRTVVATNALELGIDIGAMSASILVGYPGTIASTWQQAGRAGRGNKPALALFITTASPLDQFLAHNPKYFFERTPEKALINPDNLLILLAHLRCAIFENPIEKGDTFGNLSSDELEEFLSLLIEEGIVHKSNQKYFWMADRYPADEISLRVASPRKILLQIPQNGDWATVGEVDYESSPWLVHPNAVYIQESRVYLVDDLDLERGNAQMQLTSVDYYTIPKVDTNIEVIELKDRSLVPGGEKNFGEISVTSQVTGYRQVRWFTHEQIGSGDLDLPQSELLTMGYWLSINPETVDHLRQNGLWSNDPNQYGPNWKQQRERVRIRDEFRCQVCGREEDGRQHHVHHKTPFRQFDSYLSANQLENLVTLCPSCHRRVESAVRLRSGLSGLAYVLNNMAPIFLMCDSRDLGVYSDPQSPLASGNPTIVLFERIPAGIGFSQRLFEIHNSLITNAGELVNQCKCRDGCPSCIGPAGENGFGGKQETIALLTLLSEQSDRTNL
jgi:DEAD/DEAH box helicase domain-containing protein